MRILEKQGLEDAFEDVLNKAQRGLGLNIEELADRAGLPVETVRRLREGGLDDEALPRLAFVLNLHGPSLLNLARGTWHPQPVEDIDGFAMFTTAYGDMTVNAYLAWCPETREAVSFDTGSSCRPMLETLNERGLALKRIFITHTHADHLADLDVLRRETAAPGYGPALENPLGLKPAAHGDRFVMGGLKIRVLGTSGHTPGGLSYYIEGLAKPLVVVGDALFAASMGGAPLAYQQALENNRTHLLSLPANTVICPGHGPLTTVGEERAHNPFFPELKE